MRSPSLRTAWSYGSWRASETLIEEEMGLLENSLRSLAVMREFITKCSMVVRITVAVVSEPAMLKSLACCFGRRV